MSSSSDYKKNINKISVIFFIIILIGLLYEFELNGLTSFGFPTNIPNTVGTFYEVTKITDGDTIHINVNEEDETVRLIGINTPETVDPRKPVQCFGKEASSRLKELLSGKIVRLEYDESQSYRDAYNRILAYVYTEDNQMINRKMIAEGYAYEYTYMLPYKYQKEFRELQTLAKTSGRGLWSEETCNGKRNFRFYGSN